MARMSRRLAGVLVLLASAAVLVIETLAGRLLAPYFGVSLDTFTAIIGVVLAGIAAGTWAGGRLADRRDPHRLLAPELLVGGIATLLVVPVVRLLGPELAPAGIPGIVLLTGLAAFPPAAALSAVTPTVVKVVLADLDHTGRTVGRLSALGTVGGLLGTFGTGYLLVGTLPTSTTVLGLGAALTVAGIWRWIVDRPGEVGVPGIALPAALLVGAVGAAASEPCDVETRLVCAVVVADPADPDGRFLVLDGVDNSYVDLGDPTALRFTYTRMFAAVIDAATTGPLDTVHVGGGGLTMARWLDATRPGSTSTVLELDPALLDIAVERLGFAPDPGVRTVVGDARTTARALPSGSADLVLGDAFSGLAVPWHLTTVEFLTELDRILRPGGLYIQNVIDDGDLACLRAQAATQGEVFGEVAVVTVPERLETGGNFVVVGSETPLDAPTVVAGAAARGLDVVVLQGSELTSLVADTPPLTDDLAPVDQLVR